jgi:hypothetical protein
MPNDEIIETGGAGWEVGPSVLTSFPGASTAVVEVILAGADVEVGWAGILAALSNSDPVAATLVLSKIRSISAQEGAVLEVAQMRLPPDLYEVVKISSLALRAHRERRNGFAHSSWGRSSAIPDAIFMVPPSRLIRLHSEFLVRPGSRPGSLYGVASRHVYNAEAFARARSEARQATAVIRHLHLYFMGWAAIESGNAGPSMQNDHLEPLLKLKSYQAAEERFRRNQGRRGASADS